MTRTAVGYFHDETAANAAYDALVRRGFDRDQISIMGRGGDETGGPVDTAHHVTPGEGVATGGIVGLLLGAAATLIPGIGPVLAVGPLTAALAGAVTGGVTGAVVGGVAGALIRAGVSEEEARYYEGRFKDRGYLVVVHTDEEDYAEARRILAEAGGDVRTTAAEEATAGVDRRAPASAAAGAGWDDVLPRYRADWERRHSASGGRWEDYEPGYRYAWEMREDERFRGKPWVAVEPELRREWQVRHGNHPWDRVADVIRDVWDDRQRVELMEEQLVVRKEMREAGEVRVSKQVVELPQSIQAQVLHEEVRVQRVPVNQVVQERVAPWEENGVFVVPVYEEQLVLVKQLVLKEHVRVERTQVPETQQFQDTVRREQLVVDDPRHPAVGDDETTARTTGGETAPSAQTPAGPRR